MDCELSVNKREFIIYHLFFLLLGDVSEVSFRFLLCL